MKRVSKVGLFIVTISVLLLGTMAQAAVWTVNQTEAADFTTLAAAVANPALATGDFIRFTDATPVTYTTGTIDWAGKPDYIHVDVLHPGNITLTTSQKGIPNGMTYAFYDIKFVADNVETAMFALISNTVYFINCSFTGVVDWKRGLDIAGGTTYFNNCTFKDVAGGWAMLTWIDWAATVNFSGCTFSNIQCTAVWVRSSQWEGVPVKSTANLDQCTFTNVAQLRDTTYPALKMMDGTMNVTNSTFNLGEGYLLAQDGDAASYPDTIVANFSNCKIAKPHIDVPLISTKDAPAMSVGFANCIFDVGDAIVWGTGKAQATKSEFKFNHCLLMQNYAGWGSALQTDDAAFDTFELKNSIIESKNEGIHLPSADQLLASSNNNLLNKNGWNDSNIGADSLRNLDPLFVDAANGDYHLTEFSPCLGKGVATALTTDFDGKPRVNPVGSDPDLGPFESYLVPVELSSFSAE